MTWLKTIGHQVFMPPLIVKPSGETVNKRDKPPKVKVEAQVKLKARVEQPEVKPKVKGEKRRRR